MKQVLKDVLDRIPEALGAAVVGLDGIPVEKLVSRASFNIDLASAEWIGLVKRTASVLRSAAATDGAVEISVLSRAGLTLIRALRDDYFLCVVVGPGCVPGRARYEVWRAGVRLEQALS